MWDLEDRQGMGFIVRIQGGCKSRCVFGTYGYRVLRDLPVWTLKHGHFLIMGGIHLVEPHEADTTTAAVADLEGAVSKTVNAQPT